MPRVVRPGGQPDSRHHRQPKRQERRKRGVCIDPPGYDAGKSIKGKKRHLLVDTTGLVPHAIIHAADIQDRDGGLLLISTLFGLYPFLHELYADGGYQGPQFKEGSAKACHQINTEIAKRSDQAKGFVLLPRRWIVERTIAWLNRCRRLAKDWECLGSNGLAFLRWASIRLMMRKLCKTSVRYRMDSKRPFQNQCGTFGFGGWSAGPDVIPSRCSKPCWRSHVDADHPRAA